MSDLVARSAIKKRDDGDIFKAVADDIAKEVAAYIEVMYPEAVKAASSTFLLSVRGEVYNQIMAVKESGPLDNEEIGARLERREQWRKQWRAIYRKIRRSA